MFKPQVYLKYSSLLMSLRMSHTNGTKEYKHLLTMDNLSSAIKEVQYAVRGRVVIKAGELEKEMKSGAQKPFDRVIRANIGDCHATGQKPITFIRQVMALCSYPELMDSDLFPSDTKERAARMLKSCGGGSVGKVRLKTLNFLFHTRL
jgi:alanine transaminase